MHLCSLLNLVTNGNSSFLTNCIKNCLHETQQLHINGVFQTSQPHKSQMFIV